ncbi:MAG: leucine--tRNA ligase [Bernardetiaceae bacterium]|nr:leucine--tRNA ligase [Bernardetiaceae bacterium]
MQYNPKDIEAKWQQKWAEAQIYKTQNHSEKPKFYALDMFPYPSGAGLHIGHPLGYIASDIVARYKRLEGFNVLHPMGFDSFGLPAEQYAIETGQHPEKTTKQNIENFKNQLAKLGFSFDWEREVQTSSPEYYRWTQWIFLQIFDSWYDEKAKKARPISELIAHFEQKGTNDLQATRDEQAQDFEAQTWKQFSEKKKQEILLQYRLTYLADAMVNWCPALGTVLANDEIKDGVSERGGYPVERKKMKQWMMRITAYADRLLEGLENLAWSDAIKEMQRNWISKSYGCELDFKKDDEVFTVFTTRPDTIFGVTYLAIAPEDERIAALCTDEQRAEVEAYIEKAKNRSERERQAEVKDVTGVFTGAYAINPISGEKVQIWVADYVLAGYGTGVVMAVPASDERDFRFASHFNLPIKPVVEGTKIENGKVLEAYTEKTGKIINSDFLNGLEVLDAIQKAIAYAEEKGVGKGKVNFRLRDAVFSRQRYWGEPVPIYFKEGVPQPLPESELPLELPAIDEYKPTADGDPPLARAKDWKYKGEYEYEQTTMPGWAGSSWYFLRYADPKNQEAFADKKASDYWNSVDLYIGGTEHAVGHLLYARFWTKLLFDRGFISFDEPFKKLVNQGMIQGNSALMYKVKEENKFVSADLASDYDTTELHVDVNIVEGGVLDLEAFKKWRPETADYEFVINKNGEFRCASQVEKMSKRWYNVINPDKVVSDYSADTLRLYEMFLGPLEASKPWDTSGIEGVFKFLRKLCRLYENISDERASDAELKVLHKTIKKIREDVSRLSFNTCVSAFMVCVNDLSKLQCSKREVLEPLTVLLAPFAPHLAEELWQVQLGKTDFIMNASLPEFEEKYLKEAAHEYPISINGKVRTKIAFALDAEKEAVETAVLADETVQKWIGDKPLKKFVFVPKRIINLVV